VRGRLLLWARHPGAHARDRRGPRRPLSPPSTAHSTAALGLAILLAAGGCSPGETVHPRYGTEDGQWRSYGGDPGSSKYSPLDQIDGQNFGDLRIAWTWTSAAVRWRLRIAAELKTKQSLPYRVTEDVVLSDFQTTPIMVDGWLYGATNIGQVFALDAATGEERWVHDPRSYLASQGFLEFHFAKHRGVTYWRSAEDPDDERIFIPTIDAFLLALDAKTGEPVESFGDDGRVDLMEGLRGPPGRRLKHVFQSSPAALYRDTLIVGNSINDRPTEMRSIPGDVRAYDARTGEHRWTFHVVPAEGELGTDTWENESWRYSGAANAWGPISVDPERGLVYLATSTPTNDFYGGHRLGQNLFAETLLCLDAESGRRVWHFQLVHHGLWDYDPGAAPTLFDVEHEGRVVPAVAQVTKQSMAFVFDRVTGEPLWPIEERPVPASDVPGERASPTQPFPTKPPPYDRQGTFEEDLIDFTPELRAEALEVFRAYRTGPVFTPPSLEGTLSLPAPTGGSNWQGAAVDLETGVLYVPSLTMPTVLSVKPSDPATSDFRYETHESRVVWFPESAPRKEGLPLFKPPYSRISALDMRDGTLLWQVANGDGPRRHPRLAPLDLPPLGAGVRACALVTRTLVVAGEGSELFIDERGEPILRGFDKGTGAELGRVRLPSKTRGCPMTYLVDGVQYIAVTVADDDTSPKLVALSLPQELRR
jgi:quinoprotein glucose dehydrogenase